MWKITTVVGVAVAGLAFPCGLAAQGTRVTVTGRAVGETEAAAEEAKLDALREAVRRVCGSFINAQSEAENFTLIRDKVLEQPVGFARLVRVKAGPKQYEGLTEVQIEAEVFPAKFEKRWAEFAHILEREGNPRCVVVVVEDSDTDDGAPPQVGGVVQTELENFFLSKGVRLMDKATTDKVRARDLMLAAQNGDVAKAAAAGAAFKADVVVLGQAEAKRGDPITLAGQTLRRWHVSLAIRAIQTDSAAILVSRTYAPKRSLTTTSSSGKEGLTLVARENAPEILSDIAEAWRKRATVGKTIEVTLEPCSREVFKAVQDAFAKQKGVTGGEDGFRLRELVNRIATVDVRWKYDLNQLADRFEELHVPQAGKHLRFEVVEQTANRLTVRVRTVTGAVTRPAR